MSPPPAVRLHDPARWPQQRSALEEVRDCCSNDVLVDILTRTSWHKRDGYSPSSYGAFEGVAALAEVFDEEDEWWSLVAYIARLALRSESLFDAPRVPLTFLPPGVAGYVSLTRIEVASLLALAFFDALPEQPNHGWHMPDRLTVRSWLHAEAVDEADGHKAHCLLQYFLRIRHLEELNGGEAAESAEAGAPPSTSDAAQCAAQCVAQTDASEPIEIRRLVLQPERAAALTAAGWMACEHPLLPMEVVATGGLEEARGALQADFANEYIGGGVLCGGNVQEEIRFSICPEALVSLLLCPRMGDHEAILLSGIRQYASYEGYGSRFECTGAYADPAASSATVLAIDARPYLGEDRRAQYTPKEMLRELTKLWAGLSTDGWPAAAPPPATGTHSPTATNATVVAALTEAPTVAATAPEATAPETTGAARKRTRTTTSRSAAAPSVRSAPSAGAAGSARQPFATGNWGCGVFGGDLRLKALLQWIAASRAGRTMLYFPYGDPRVTGLGAAAARLLAAKITVGQLARALLKADRTSLQGGRALDAVLEALGA